jgi:two-component system response regulator YesN
MAKEKWFTRHVIIAVNTIKAHIDNHPRNGESAASLAAQAGISRNTLQEAFKDQYGTDIREYKLRLRMEFARQQLKEGRSIKEIQLALNYSSPSTFTKAFKKFYDLTPTEWVLLQNEAAGSPVQ